MATLKDTSALASLNEKDYINGLYDKSGDTQKQMLQDNYTQNTGVLDTEQQSVQQQTDTNLNRTYVEAAKQAGAYAGSTGQKTSAAANQQAALVQGNTQQKNVTTLQDKQAQADAEIERQRALLAEQYSAAIKQAQADNDMQRAQALYDAAKTEDAQILAYKKKAAALLAENGDNSLYDSLLKTGGGSSRNESTTPSWAEVLKNEGSINQIYDAQMESEKQGLLMDYQKAASELEAKREAQTRETDQSLTEAYVNALKGAKNYAENQTAYGQGSGTMAQAKLARDSELLQELTRLRGVQTDADAQLGMEGYDLGATYWDAVAKANADNDTKRLAALIKAAEDEEATLAKNQELVGQQYAKNGDYSILGKLYGLTPEQIARLQGYGSSGGAGTVSYATWLANLSNKDRAAYEASQNGGKATAIFDGSGTVNNAVTKKENIILKNAASTVKKG